MSRIALTGLAALVLLPGIALADCESEGDVVGRAAELKAEGQSEAAALAAVAADAQRIPAAKLAELVKTGFASKLRPEQAAELYVEQCGKTGG